MATLEELKPGVKVRGIIPGQSVSVVDVKWHGSTAVELYYKRADKSASLPKSTNCWHCATR